MICPHCGAQWMLPSESEPIKKCPFCQKNMCTSNQNLTTIEAVLKEIVARFGICVLRDSQELLSIFSELAPTLTEEKKLLQFFTEYGNPTELIELRNASATEQKAGLKKCIQHMTDTVTEVCTSFLSAINIDIETDIQNQTCLEFEYIDIGDETIELTSCKTPLQEMINFPKMIDGKRVISIAGTIFGTSKLKESERDKVKCLRVPEGVIRIGDSAFYGCKALDSIILPDSLDSIGDYAFRSCKALSKIDLPKGLKSIGKGAFAGSGLKNISLPDCLTSISAETFKNCKSLIKVEWSHNLNSIGNEAFSGCKSLVNIVLPENIESIGDKVFYDCKFLTKVTLPNGINILGYNVFGRCEALKNINLPDSISHIGAGAFCACFSLDNIILPPKITSIEGEVFDRCRSLESVCIPEGVTSIGYGAFYSCYGLKRITIPNSVAFIESDAFSYCEDFTVYCYEGSYAHAHAIERKWKVELV